MLAEYVQRRDLPAVRGAARGLACFAAADGATRKLGFEPAFKTLIYVHDQLASQEHGVLGVEEYWYELETTLAATLSALAGRTENMRWVNFDGPHSLVDGFADVCITEAMPNSLRGRLVA